MTHRKKACDLRPGDRIIIPPTLLPTNAVVASNKPVPARGGQVWYCTVEFDFGAAKGIKSEFCFREDDEKVQYIPLKRSWFSALAFPFTFWLS